MKTRYPADRKKYAGFLRLFSLWIILLPGFFLFQGCVSTGIPRGTDEIPDSGEFAPGWQEIDPGLDYYSYTDPEIPVRLFCLKVDMDSGFWEPVLTKPAEEEDGEFYLEGIRTSEFLKREDCLAAVNGGPFMQYRWFFSGRGQDPAGIYVWNNIILGEPIERFGALVFESGGGMSVRSQEEYPFAGDYVLGGFRILLKEGESVASEEGPRDARTAAGVSSDGKTLYLLVADGRRSGYSMGLTENETALYLKNMGAWNGLNLDGGGSSVMVFRESDGDNVFTVNRPVNLRGFPERIVATHLGIRRRRF